MITCKLVLESWLFKEEMMMKFKKDEQETVITYEAKTGVWTFYTCVPSHIHLFMQNPLINQGGISVLTLHEGNPSSIRFTVKDSLVNKRFFKQKRILSDKQKQSLANGREKALKRFAAASRS